MLRFAALVIVVPLLLAADDVPTAIELKSESGKKAKAQYDRDVSDLHGAYRSHLKKVHEKYADELAKVRKIALEANDLDEAQRVVATAKQVEAAIKKTETAEIPPAPVPPPKMARFEIIAARWGAQDGWADVTKLVSGKIKNGRLVIAEPEKAGLGDPKNGAFKSLVVVYSLNGVVLVDAFAHNQRVSLPKP